MIDRPRVYNADAHLGPAATPCDSSAGLSGLPLLDAIAQSRDETPATALTLWTAAASMRVHAAPKPLLISVGRSKAQKASPADGAIEMALMHYAIIEAGGKQHRVTEGERLRIDLVNGKQAGDSLTFDRVLMVRNGDDIRVGTPLVEGVTIDAKVVRNGADGTGEKDKKVIVFKKNRRKGYMKKQGHRQRYTEIEVGKLAF